MSHDYGQLGNFSFSSSNGFVRSDQVITQQQHQIPRDKLMMRDPTFGPPPTPLMAIDETAGLPPPPMFQTAENLSEMFNFPPAAAAHSCNYRNSSRQLHPPPPQTNGWYGTRQEMMNEVHSAADAMQFFVMNPARRSPSPPPPPPAASADQSQFTWVNSNNDPTHRDIRGFVEGHGQGLSLSLSSSLQQLEVAKAAELRNIGGVINGNLFFNNNNDRSSNSDNLYHNSSDKNIIFGNSRHHQMLPNSGDHDEYQVSLGLKNSKYAKAVQELLEEFCSVGRIRHHFNISVIQNKSNVAATTSSSSSKDVPPLSTADRIDHQRRKVKLLSMLDEVERRYNHYCEQMRAVVNSFDVVMGFGAAGPYTAMARKAMSRHFRCLKDAIAEELRHSCEMLGDKEGAASSGGKLTKGETPRLRLLEQSLRQQRAFHQMGMNMMDQDAWRPQRGLPERSVTILRAWLFEHFLHPYPSDADKHLLARRTGLSRNQVANWFINARVRLWKPMVEEMYQQESVEDDDGDEKADRAAPEEEAVDNKSQTSSHHHHATAQTPTQPTPTQTPKISQIDAPDSDPSLLAINTNTKRHPQQVQLAAATTAVMCGDDMIPPPETMPGSTTTGVDDSVTVTVSEQWQQRVGTVGDACRRGSVSVLAAPAEYRTASDMGVSSGHHLVRLGTTPGGDVSLTLGLRHAGNLPEETPFPLGDFGNC